MRLCWTGAPYGASRYPAPRRYRAASLEGLLHRRFSTYSLVHLSTVGRLFEVGLALLPTFNQPHYTVLLPGDHDEALTKLLSALGPAEENPYHGHEAP